MRNQENPGVANPIVLKKTLERAIFIVVKKVVLAVTLCFSAATGAMGGPPLAFSFEARFALKAKRIPRNPTLEARVIHSTTKYLGCHSDLRGGVVIGPRRLLEPIWMWRKNLGQMMGLEAAFHFSHNDTKPPFTG
jgi:hypothetical protein